MVIEYNVRMGDPETEVVMLRLASDLVKLMDAAASGELGVLPLEHDERAATTVMMVSGGYPGSYAKGKVITGLDNVPESVIFQAGTTMNDKGETVTSGGRVLAVSSYGMTIEDALATSYRGVERIHFDNSYYRKDIGRDLL